MTKDSNDDNKDLDDFVNNFEISKNFLDKHSLSLALNLKPLCELFRSISRNPSLWIVNWAILIELSSFHKKYFTRREMNRILWWIENKEIKNKLFKKLVKSEWVCENNNNTFSLTTRGKYVITLLSSLANPDIDLDAIITAINTSFKLGEEMGLEGDDFFELKQSELIQALNGDLTDINDAIGSCSYLALERIVRIGKKHLNDIEESHNLIDSPDTNKNTKKSIHELVSKIESSMGVVFTVLRKEYERELYQKMSYITLKDLDIFLNSVDLDELSSIVGDFYYVSPNTPIVDYISGIDYAEMALLKVPEKKYDFNEPLPVEVTYSEVDYSEQPLDPFLIIDKEIESQMKFKEELQIKDFVPSNKWGKSIFRLMSIFRIVDPPESNYFRSKIDIRSNGLVENINLKSVEILTKSILIKKEDEK